MKKYTFRTDSYLGCLFNNKHEITVELHEADFKYYHDDNTVGGINRSLLYPRIIFDDFYLIEKKILRKYTLWEKNIKYVQ